MPMSEHQLAVEICRREGKKIQVNIAQVKEILRILVDIGREEMAKHDVAKANMIAGGKMTGPQKQRAVARRIQQLKKKEVQVLGKEGKKK